MKIVFRALAVLLILAFAVGAALFVVRFRNSVVCATGDLTLSLSPEAATKLGAEFGWLRRAKLCDMGEYLVATSLESGGQPVVVLEKRVKQRMIFAVTPNQTALFDPRW